MEKYSAILINYKDLSKKELKELPVDELAEMAHEALQNWDKLNQRLNQDSTNSSRAPSTDSPETKAKRKTETSPPPKHGTRKQGAQAGHKAVTRPLVPLCGNNVIIDCKPEICAHCGEPLEEQNDPEPYRQQHYDFEIIRHVTEYRKHNIVCPNCGEITEGTLSKEANESTYSSNVAALIGVLTGFFRMSRRMTKEFVQEVVGIPLSVGSVSNIEKELTETMIPVMEEIETAVENARQGNADETSFGMKNGKRDGCGYWQRRRGPAPASKWEHFAS
jgi:transposase